MVWKISIKKWFREEKLKHIKYNPLITGNRKQPDISITDKKKANVYKYIHMYIPNNPEINLGLCYGVVDFFFVR